MKSTEPARGQRIDQLNAADRFMMAVVESSDDAIITKDLNATITSWNRSAERLFGYTAEEAVGQPVSILIPPGREDEEPSIMARLRKGEVIDHYQTVRRHKDGSLVDISITVSPVKDGEGKVIGASKVARDISSQMKLDSALRFMAAIVESSDDAIITKNLDGIIMSWNRSAEKLFGYPAEEVIGKPISILIPQGREDEEPNILARVRKGELIDHYQTVRRRKDGTLVDISITISPVKDQHGKVIGASKIARDISSQKKSESLLRYMAAIVQSSDDAIITKDLGGIIMTWNRGAEKLFGYLAEEVIGKPVAILIPRGRENEEPNILGRIRRGEKIDHYETVRMRKDGALLEISITVSPVKDERGIIVGASKIARDITSRKRADLELARVRSELTKANTDLETRVRERTVSLQLAVEQMEEFSYSVSHDLRSPVRAMTGYATSTLEDFGPELNETVRHNLQYIVGSGTRMQRLVDDLLIYSRVARAEVVLQAVAMDTLVPQIIDHYETMQLPNAEIVIRRPLQAALAHEPSLTQAISNLLANGVKFVAPGTLPKLQIWTERNNGHVRLWIQDNGIGIKPEYQNRLFSMFERMPTPATTYEGTGIGLSIVRKTIEKMGGKVGMKSDGVSGCSFWIELSAVP